MVGHRLTNLDTQEQQTYPDTPAGLRPLHLLEVPYIPVTAAPGESVNRLCAAACGTALIQAYKKDEHMTVSGVLEGMEAAAASELIYERLRACLNEHGIPARWETGLNLFDLLSSLRSEKPLVLLMEFGVLEEAGLHGSPESDTARFVLLIGMDNHQACIHDPGMPAGKGTARCLPLSQFESALQGASVGGEAGSSGLFAALAPVHGLNDPAILDGPLYRVRTRFKLNIRSGPSAGFADIGDVPPGVEKDILQEGPNHLFGKISSFPEQWISVSAEHVERLSGPAPIDQTGGALNPPSTTIPDGQTADPTNPPVDTSDQSHTGSGAGELPSSPGALYRVKALIAINIRSGPGKNFTDVGDLPAGSECDILAENADGSYGEIAPNRWVFVKSKFVKRLTEPVQVSPSTGSTNVGQPDLPTIQPEVLYRVRVIGNLNIRSGPSINTTDLGDLRIGDEADILEESADKTYGKIAPNRWITLSPTYVRRIEKPAAVERALSPASQPSVLYRVRVNRGIHIRSGPSINTTDVGDMAPGDEADILEENAKKSYGRIAPNRWITLHRAYVERI